MTTTAVNVYRHRHAARTPYIDRELMSEETCPYPIGHAAGLRLSHSGSLPQRATVDGPWGKPGCTRLGRQISANSQAWCVARVSPLVRRPTFPPVVGRFLSKNTRRDLRRYVVAELPQLLRCAGVLIEHLVDTEGVQLAGAKAIDSFADMCNEDGQLRLLIGRHNAACSPSLRLARHDLRIRR